jgi:hypothetical protein
VTVDNIVPILIVAVVVISSLGSGLRKVKRGFDGVVEKQRAEEPQRLAALKAEMARRGVTPPAALQGLIAALESAAAEIPATPPPQQQQQAYAAQAAYVAQPAYASPQQQQQAAQRHSRHKHQQQPQPAEPEVRRAPVPVARTVDVPIFPSPPPLAAVGTTRRTLVDAFGDPAHARNAVILMEVLAPPVALR